MPAQRKSFGMDHPIIITFLIFAIIAFMYLAAEVLKPLALAILLSFALAPLVTLLERRKVPRAAAVVLSLVISLGALSVVGYIVQDQLNALIDRLPSYEKNMLAKVKILSPSGESRYQKATDVVTRVASELDKPALGAGAAPEVQEVRIVEQPSLTKKLEGAVGPIVEPLAIGSFVLILTLFMLTTRDDLRDRMVQIFGGNRVSVTTRTLEEVGARISRYLGMFALVNSTFGLVVGLGLWAIGLPYAALWGFLAAGLRFVPYLGPATAFALPLIFSIAHSEGGTWRETLLVAGLFGTLEVVANSFLEPIVYGKTTGVSALGLLVAAMFWTWLWGALGLLLSTPMTVCLAVLGKVVPQLRVFGTLLGEEAEVDADIRVYQRLLAVDSDGAEAIIDAELKKRPQVEVCDEILIPVLSRAERDFARDEIDDRERAFIWRVISGELDDHDATPEISLANTAAAAHGTTRAAASKVIGLATNDTADALTLRMLAQALVPSGCTLTILDKSVTGYDPIARLTEEQPDLVVISHLPPDGLTPARQLIRRVRAKFPDLPIVVGRWGEEVGQVERLTQVGASHVVADLTETRDLILGLLAPTGPAPAAAKAGAA